VVLALAGSACGPPKGAVEVPPKEIPFALARTPTPGPTTNPVTTVTVYFVKGGRLAPFKRAVDRDAAPGLAALGALLRGPAPEERTSGVVSEIPPQTSLLELRVLEHVADADLSVEFQSPAPPRTILLRVAQVVWTLVALPDVTSVRFSIEGDLVAVVTDGGEAVRRPVTSLDYGSVSPIVPE